MATKKKDPDPVAVESFEVDAHTDRVVVTINDNPPVVFDTEQLLAFTKLLDAAKVGANY